MVENPSRSKRICNRLSQKLVGYWQLYSLVTVAQRIPEHHIRVLYQLVITAERLQGVGEMG